MFKAVCDREGALKVHSLTLRSDGQFFDVTLPGIKKEKNSCQPIQFKGTVANRCGEKPQKQLKNVEYTTSKWACSLSG